MRLLLRALAAANWARGWVHAQGRPNFGQQKSETRLLLPGLPFPVYRDPILVNKPIQGRARNSKLPHDFRRANHLFFPHAPSVAAVLIVPLVPDHGRMVQLGHLGRTRQGVHNGQ